MTAQNSITTQIARPYAIALFDLARENNELPQVEQSLNAISAMAEGNPDFQRFLRSPAISTEEKRSAMDAIVARARMPETVAKFVRLVAGNGRLFALPTMIATFKEMAANARGEVRAEVVSAEPLTRAQADQLGITLHQKLGKVVTLEQRVDPSLIGGLVVRVGSKMIDSSLKTKLTAMKIAMKGAR